MVKSSDEELNNIKLMLNITDDVQDKLLDLLNSDCKQRIVAYINQDSITDIKYPSALDWITRELVVRRFNRLGDEGKSSSSENDVSASWKDDDMSEFSKYMDKYRKKQGGSGIARFH